MSKAIIKTEKGDMTVAFYDQDAPNTVANFLKKENILLIMVMAMVTSISIS